MLLVQSTRCKRGARGVGRAAGLLAVALLLVPACATAAAGERGADAAARRALAVPQPQAPEADATVRAVPAFRWAPVRGADRYEFNLSASRSFESIVHGQGRGSFQTANTFATVEKTLADGEYFWRVRAIDAKDRAGQWSRTRAITKRWGVQPTPEAPVGGATLIYPRDPLLLRWSAVPGAFKYLVQVATDPSLAQSVITTRAGGVETSGRDFAIQGALPAGTYYWAVTPLDGDKHPGARSEVASFELRWPSGLNEATELAVSDLDARAEVFDPQLTWEPIPGAVRYDVEISTAINREGGGRSFPEDSVVCCTDPATGTSLSPVKLLAHNTGSGVAGDPEQFGYWWRVRGVDPDGNAGQWNYGPAFDNSYPVTLGNLHVRDSAGDVATDLEPASAVTDTSSPILTWQAAPGASSYEVKIVPHVSLGGGIDACNWSASPSASNVWDVVTASTSWTPLGNSGTRRPLGILTNLQVSREIKGMIDGQAYCAQVRARRDRDRSNKEVVGPWTTIGNGSAPAFRYVAPPEPSGSTLQIAAGDYLAPTVGSTQQAAPLFTWKPVDGARGYFVVVARDAEFTKIVDLAFTNMPAYAPRRGAQPFTYPDETTSYWWAVIPTAQANGDLATTQAKDNAPQRFIKQSAPPVARDPQGGETVSRQPTFRWDPTVGARSYTLEIAQDPSFGDPLISVTTASTGYTTAATMPADTVLYWRVRANDENNIGLGWSATQQFRRVLPKVVLAADNPSGGEGIPTFRWSPVQGAVSYDMHVEQVDGTKRDFTFRTTAFTPVLFYGTGIWTWQVRANFKFGTSVVSGGYSPAIPFARRISTPTGVHTVKAGKGVLLEWDPALMAKQYRVEVSTSDSFTVIIERAVTGNASFAPRMRNPAYKSGQPLYWRVASVDEGRNLGGWASRAMRAAKKMRLRLRGALKREAARTVRATVTDKRGRPMKGAKVLVTGPGLRVRPRQTSATGKVSFRIRPRLAGKVRFQAEKPGYKPASKSLRVR